MKKTFLLLVEIVCSCLVWGQTIPINTIDDLADLAMDIVAQNGYDGQTIEINADLTVTKIWTPIGTAAQPFQGTVKGNGHIISGLGAVKGTDGIGVFGYVGENAVIEDLGIGTGHIKTMKNDVCLYVGTLAGHNKGTINRCWNMATLEVNGTNVGGLVGWNEGEITDCYNAGPITKATDYIGGLVGTNKGKISYCYNIGFVRNGLGLVATNEGGIITEAYYDRQLYIQSPDAAHPDPAGVVAKDKTIEMFSLFHSRDTWTNSADNYPVLTSFKDHDAAQVSVASIDVTNDGNSEPNNHLNQLVSNFKVNQSNDVEWAKISPIGDSWIAQDPQNPNIWNVDRPCRITEVIMVAGKYGHVREVIAIPMHIEDFLPGSWGGDTVLTTLNNPLYLRDIPLKKNDDPSGGKPAYRGKLVITCLEDNVDTIIIEEDTWTKYTETYINQSWTPAKPGRYVLKRYTADAQCHIDWEESEGEVVVVCSPDSINEEVVICESQFVDGKYTYYYPNSENPRKKIDFYLNDLKPESFWDAGGTSTYPSYVTLTPVVLPSPVIQTEDNVEVCQDRGDGMLTIYFKMEKGSANMYYIELSESLRPYFDNQAYISGFMPNVREGDIGIITLYCEYIGFLGGEKNLYLQVGISEEEGQSSCLSEPRKIKLNVTQGGYIKSKYDKVLFIDNNPEKETDPKFIGYQWYKNGFVIKGATGQYYHEGGRTLAGSYFADLTYMENGKEIVLRTCTLQMPLETKREAGAPTSNVTKQLENGQIIIQRGGAKYNIFGNKMSNL